MSGDARQTVGEGQRRKHPPPDKIRNVIGFASRSRFGYRWGVPPILQAMLVSASLGALIGTIRQWGQQREPKPEDGFAGVRTFTLWALLGTTAAAISAEFVPATFVATLLLIGGHLILRGVFGRIDFKIGFTTTAASLLTFLMGGLVYWQHTQAAVVLSAGTMLLLGLKQPIHAWTRKFTEADIRSTLQFVAITGVILPLVPNRSFGPYNAFNPHSMWLMVVLISGLGFIGYLLMRFLGTNAGVTVTGLVGGLASSTATTLAFSRRSREDPGSSGAYVLAVVLASLVMLARVAAVVLALQREIFAFVWPTLLAMALPGVAYTVWILIVRPLKPGSRAEPDLKNPLSLSIAIKFAAIYSVITLLIRAVSEEELTTGLLAVAFLSGLTDVDAVTLTTIDSTKSGALAAAVAAQVIVIATMANTLSKAMIAVFLGSPGLRKSVALIFGITVATGVAVSVFW